MHSLHDSGTEASDGVASLDIIKFGSGLVVSVGYISGIVKLWETRSIATNDVEGGPSIRFILGRTIEGSHGAPIISSRFVSTPQGTWLLTGDLHGRLVCHNISKYMNVAAQAISGLARQLTGYSGGHSLVVRLDHDGLSEQGIVCHIVASPEDVGNTNLSKDPMLSALLLLVTSSRILVCELNSLGVHVRKKLFEHDSGDLVSAAWRFVDNNTNDIIIAIGRNKNLSLVRVEWERDPSTKEFHVTNIDCISDSDFPTSILAVKFLRPQNCLTIICNSEKELGSMEVIIQQEEEYLQLSSSSGNNEEHLTIYDWLVPRHFDLLNEDLNIDGSIVEGGDQILLLVSNGLISLHLLSWQQKIGALVSENRLREALAHCVRLFYGLDTDNINNKHLWPSERAVSSQRNQVIQQALTICIPFIQACVGADHEAHGVAVRTRILSVIQVCILMQKIDFLYDDLASILEKHLPEDELVNYRGWGIFLEALECEILHGRLAPTLPPAIIQALVEYFVSKNQIERIERVILRFDVASLDLNQLIPLCLSHSLFSAIIFIFTRALNDYKSPAILIFTAAVEEWVSRGENGVLQDPYSAHVLKLLLYFRTCFRGELYPPGSGKVDAEKHLNMRLEVFKVLLYTTHEEIKEVVHLWASVGAQTKRGSWEHFASSPSPFMDFLCLRGAPMLLDIIKEGLTGWDALESDVCTSFGNHSNEVKTLTQVVVDRVVGRLTSQSDNLDPVSTRNKTAMLEFIANSIASNRATIESAVLMTVLKYLAEEAVSDEISTRHEKLFSDIVNSVPSSICDESLEIAEKAGYATVQAKILHQQDKLFAALECLLSSPRTASLEAFDYFENVMVDPSINCQSKVKLFERATYLIPQMARANTERSAQVVLDFMSHSLDQVLKILEPSPDIQFGLLKCILDILKNQELSESVEVCFFVVIYVQRTPRKPYPVCIPQVSQTSNINSLMNDSSTSSLYLKLLCSFEPSSVLEFLKSNDSYDLDVCLSHCLECNLLQPAAYILERKGDIAGAVELHIEVSVFLSRLI